MRYQILPFTPCNTRATRNALNVLGRFSVSLERWAVFLDRLANGGGNVLALNPPCKGAVKIPERLREELRISSGPRLGDFGPARRARSRPMIGIGGRLAAPPLPHHLAYGSVPRRFDRVTPLRRHRDGASRDRRKHDCAGLAAPPGVMTCANIRWASLPQPPRGTSARRGGEVP
jgi:hypothetical protein